MDLWPLFLVHSPSDLCLYIARELMLTFPIPVQASKDYDSSMNSGGQPAAFGPVALRFGHGG
jgi:hypothetical protein